MQSNAQQPDVTARRLISAVSGQLRSWVGLTNVDSELVGDLYLRLRDILSGPHETDACLIDEVALTIYLTAAASDPSDRPKLSVLSSIREVIETVLGDPIHLPPGPAEARHFETGKEKS